MYRWLNESGEIVRTKTVKEFATLAGMSYGNARNLSCGYRLRHEGWLTPARIGKRTRDRFKTVLVNTRTGERFLLGRSAKHFAKMHGVSSHGVSELIRGTKVAHLGCWMLEKTWESVSTNLPKCIPEKSTLSTLTLCASEVMAVM